MSAPTINWKVAGYAGEGVKTTGLLFSKSCLRQGLYTFDYTEYPSLIRGGHNTYQVLASQEKLHSQEFAIDVLVALNQNAVKFHQNELKKDAVIIYDQADDNYDISQYNLECSVYNIPMVELAKSVGAERVMQNNVALGVSLFLFGLKLETINNVIQDVFGSKGAEVVELNQKAAAAGYEYAKKNCEPHPTQMQAQNQTDTVAMFGNDALSLGAVAGGLKAYIAYPMTPASSILHTMAGWAEKAGLMVKHAEDEIGVINMALGSSFAGVRVAVGTSGGGFTYMTEALGNAGVAELPIVIYEAQRPGPALGMPTWTGQADLLFVINASQDEFPRIVLAPGDVKEAFHLSRQAFELAEKFQLPVIVLSDKHLSESAQSTHFDQLEYNQQQVSLDHEPQLDENGFYPRHMPTDSGLSKRTIPGQKDGFYISNSYEHDRYGLGTEEGSVRIEQMDKRFRKLDTVKSQIPQQFYDGSENPQVTFISFGSTKGAVQAGIEQLREEGIDAASYNISWVWPFPAEQTRQVIEASQNPVVIEGNKTSQLAKLIRQETGIEVYHKRTRYDGRPFYPSQVVQYAKEIVNG